MQAARLRRALSAAAADLGRRAVAGHWHDGDPAVMEVFDSGYDLTRLAWLLADLPVTRRAR